MELTIKSSLKKQQQIYIYKKTTRNDKKKSKKEHEIKFKKINLIFHVNSYNQLETVKQQKSEQNTNITHIYRIYNNNKQNIYKKTTTNNMSLFNLTGQKLKTNLK